MGTPKGNGWTNYYCLIYVWYHAEQTQHVFYLQQNCEYRRCDQKEKKIARFGQNRHKLTLLNWKLRINMGTWIKIHTSFHMQSSPKQKKIMPTVIPGNKNLFLLSHQKGIKSVITFPIRQTVSIWLNFCRPLHFHSNFLPLHAASIFITAISLRGYRLLIKLYWVIIQCCHFCLIGQHAFQPLAHVSFPGPARLHDASHGLERDRDGAQKEQGKEGVKRVGRGSGVSATQPSPPATDLPYWSRLMKSEANDL